jgi:hypothetical protein
LGSRAIRKESGYLIAPTRQVKAFGFRVEGLRFRAAWTYLMAQEDVEAHHRKGASASEVATFNKFVRIPPESQGQNVALTVSYVQG